METFLNQVATHLYQQFAGDFTQVAIVFPNRRAGLFFNDALAKISSAPMWAPTYISISDLFEQAGDMPIADPIQLVCELYHVFRSETGSNESLDDFYHWGELLLSDFDDADKNMADTQTLFRNLRELNELSIGYTFLEEGQKEALETFFTHFSVEQDTELKSRFTAIWNRLGPIYTRFRERLASKRIAYPGMLYRQIVEAFDETRFHYRTYVFVGFNVLNKVEQQLFTRLQAAGKAIFYWDYDNYYFKQPNHEAGEFIRRNLKTFPNQLSDEYFNNLSQPKDLHIIRASTESAQARYLPQWIRQYLTAEEKETAVVLCNETLLQPVLHALPENVKQTNLTMGFPLQQTPVYSLLKSLLELYTEGYREQTGRFDYTYIQPLLLHPYVRQLSSQTDTLLAYLRSHNLSYPLPTELHVDAELTCIFTPVTGLSALCKRIETLLRLVAQNSKATSEADETLFTPLYHESLFKGYTLVNRFAQLVEQGILDVEATTFTRLLSRVMTTTRIPFHGEPAIGLQIMGVLETRNLDFKHLLLLSVNEGQLPQSGGTASFLPYNLRKAFGMTTIDHEMAVYAYYFYRMIQRAEHVTLVYNTTTDGLRKGEASRFVLQLQAEYPHPIRLGQLELAQSPHSGSAPIVSKTPAVLRQLIARFDRQQQPKALLSPSALNTYLDCPLRFYYHYVARLTPPDTVTTEVDAAQFGTIFHQVAEWIYEDLKSHDGTISANAIDGLLKNQPRIERYIDHAFKTHFFKVPLQERVVYNGVQLLHFTVIQRYITRLLQLDRKQASFVYLQSEQAVSETYTLSCGATPITIAWGGIIDRIDCKEHTLRIIDYKTGGDVTPLRDLDALFIPDAKRSHHHFQTFLYATILTETLRKQQSSLKYVSPCLLYIHRAAATDYSPVIRIGTGSSAQDITDFTLFEAPFRSRLYALFNEIFNPDIPFAPTDIESYCTYCDFKKMCNR